MSYYLKYLCFMRITLAVSLSMSVLFRYCGLSFVYLIFLLFLPRMHTSSNRSRTVGVKFYLLAVLVFSVIMFVAQLAAQVALKFVTVPRNSTKELVLHHVGFVSVIGIPPLEIVRHIGPEVLMLLTSIIVFLVCGRSNPQDVLSYTSETKFSSRKRRFFVILGNSVALLSLCFAGILFPSILSSIYYLAFLTGMTLWAWQSLLYPIGVLMSCIQLVVALHVTAFYIVHLQFIQNLVKGYNGFFRILGLTIVVEIKSSDPRLLHFAEADWTEFVNPVFLLWLNYITGIQSHFQQIKEPSVQIRNNWQPEEKVESTDDSSRQKKQVKPSSSRDLEIATILENLRHSIMVTTSSHLRDVLKSIEILAGQSLEEQDYHPGAWDKLLDFLSDFTNIITRSSHFLAHVSMLSWSITYHSYLTFVWLLWVCVLFVLPHQRRATLKCSPFLLGYAMILLTCQYVYSMDVKLPETVNGVNLSQVGLSRPLGLPCVPLAMKSLYTLFFWTTFYQYREEKLERKLLSLIKVGSATFEDMFPNSSSRDGILKLPPKSKAMEKLVKYCKRALTKYWIWLVVCSLLVFGLFGTTADMNVDRIMFTALFLIFVIVLQLSFRIWRKILLFFWIIMIAYSMAMLVTNYIHQFDHVPTFWNYYFHIPKHVQEDLGMYKLTTSYELFIRLLCPTFLLIITVVQLRYFHRDFLKLTEIPSRTEELLENEIREQVTIAPRKSSVVPLRKAEILTMKHLKHMARQVQTTVKQTTELMWLFVELHALKLVLVCVMVHCMLDVCAVNFIILFLVVLSLLCGRYVQKITTHIVSILASVFLLTKMIYQFTFFQEDLNNCKELGSNIRWFGLFKFTGYRAMIAACKGQLIVIGIATAVAVVKGRQLHKFGTGVPRTLMFPNITRPDADKDTVACIKYLFNYGFFKFGLEICLLMTMILVVCRMDVCALLYVLWLCLISFMKRKRLAKIWIVYQLFITLLIPVQYAIVLNLPPIFCHELQWNQTTEMEYLQQWMFLPDVDYPPSPYKLIFDCVLLVLVYQQRCVFHTEKLFRDKPYPGGNNRTIWWEGEKPDFVNIVPDHTARVRTWLEIIKYCLFSSFPWITALVLLFAGTQRLSVFSAGYLVGAFVFLWKADSLFLYPLPYIRKQCNVMLAYNLTVVLFRNSQQLFSIFYFKTLQNYACSAIELLVLTYIERFFTRPRSSLAGELECANVDEQVGLHWEVLCFLNIIVLKRFSRSYYFMHHVNDTKAGMCLASRGLELMEELKHKFIEASVDQENRILDKMKLKTERIRAAHRKNHGPSYKEPEYHHTVVRSADYALFDETDEVLVESVSEQEVTQVGGIAITLSKNFDLFKNSRQLMASKFSLMLQFLANIFKTDVEAATALTLTANAPPEDAVLPSEDDKGKASQEEKEPRKESRMRSFGRWVWLIVKFCWAIIESGIESIVTHLNHISNNYYYIRFVLSSEIRLLKNMPDFNKQGVREGPHRKWHPRPEEVEANKAWIKNAKEQKSDVWRKLSRSDNKNFSEMILSIQQSHRTSVLVGSSGAYEHRAMRHPAIVKLLLAMWIAFLSHLDLLCYFLVFLYQMKSASILSIPLPLMVFLWGTLLVPKPSSRFWVIMITYTEIIFILKWIGQFDSLLGSDRHSIEKSVFSRSVLIGIAKSRYYAVYDVLLLLALFLHRYMLESLGLWDLRKERIVVCSEEDYVHEYTHSIAPEETDVNIQPTQDGSGTHLQIICSDEHEVEDFGAFLVMSVKSYCSAVTHFFRDLRHPSSYTATDVYALMFFCDFFNFLLLIFSFSAFRSAGGGGDIASYMQENKVPVPFLVMLIVQFILIVVDRALYLRRCIIGKLVLQYILIVAVHVWMFLLLPLVTDRPFSARLPPQMWYMVKCFYLLLSAYQIRSGYPMRVIGNFLCKNYDISNHILFQGFRLIPFLFELRMLMDWIWTDTTLTLYEWLKLEDIFATVFARKCLLNFEHKYPSPRGALQTPRSKLLGAALVLLIFIIIWFPLFFFAFGRTGGTPTLPTAFEVTLDIEHYEPIYKMSASNNSIVEMDASTWEKMQRAYSNYKSAKLFLSAYDNVDVAVIKLRTDSRMMWGISPPDRANLIEDLISDRPVEIHISWLMSRKNLAGVVETFTESHSYALEATTNSTPNELRERLISVIAGNESSAIIPYIFPKFLEVSGNTRAHASSQLMEVVYSPYDKTYRNVTLQYNSDNESSWWSVKELCTGYNYEVYLKKIYDNDCDDLVVITFNDRPFPKYFSFFSASGIIGLYVGVVFLCSRVFRSMLGERSKIIQETEMPNVDRILQLCLDIYLVRECREFLLEEELYAKLVFLYRSPETIIRWTRLPENQLQLQSDNSR